MAYAALISLFNAIEYVLESHSILITSSTREILLSAYDQAWLQNTLSEGWCSQVVSSSDEPIKIITEEAARLQDAIEFSVSTQLLHQSKICKPTFSLNLEHLRQDVHRFASMAEDMIGRIKELWEQRVARVIQEQIVEICVPGKEEGDVSAEPTDPMAGLDVEFQKLKRTMLKNLHKVYWFNGMAGIGKTRFAQRFYHDPGVREKFECWAFVRVGREYSTERLLRSLNAQLNRGDMEEGDNLEDIQKSLETTLSLKRTFIVLDDVWDYDFVKYIINLQKTLVCQGRKMLVTSRMEPEPHFTRSGYKLRFLSGEESWELLRRKVFGGEVCPLELVEPGKKIAKKCGGLPLLIIAVAPILLRKADKDPKRWNAVAEKPSSLLEEASLEISQVLLTSYSHLDEIYKLHFLYITSFPESYVVFCSTIGNLWYAEGFSKFASTLNAFNLLSEKNLVIGGCKNSLKPYRIKACRLHCAYWYVNKSVAKDDRFLYIMNSYTDGMDEVVKNHHRLAIQTNVLLAIKEVFDHITSISTVRSILCTGPYHQYQVPMSFKWKMLRILDAVTIRFYEFPVEVVKLVLLRYLALTCNADLPTLISKLWNLEVLIVRQHLRIRQVTVESFVPVEVWCLQELIHLEIMGKNLPEPPHPSVVLPNLERLLDVGVESCTKGVLGNIPKLRKLRIQTELAPDVAKDLRTCFSDVESFQCVVMNPTLLPPPLPLSVSILSGIKKLSLSGFGYPWEEMSKLANLQNLEVLKLRSYAFRGEKWKVNKEMIFKKLRYLYIEDTDLVKWTMTLNQAVPLEVLKLKNCYKLREIPRRHVIRHAKIELIDCNPLIEILLKDENAGYFYYTVSYSWKEKKV